MLFAAVKIGLQHRVDVGAESGVKDLLGRLIGRKASPRERWVCACCDRVHRDLPAATFPCPWVWSEENAAEFDLTTDTCIWRDEHFFIRACLDLPFTDREGAFQFGVWTTLSRDNFLGYLETFENGALRRDMAPMFGWFSNSLPGYPETLNLRCMLHPRLDGLRPLIELLDDDHPLMRQQRNGVTVEEVTAYLHEHLGTCRA